MGRWSIIFSDFSPSKPTFTEKNYPDLSGKVYLVTGSTTGIGLATAKLLAGQKAKVYICGRSEEKVEKAKKAVLAENESASLGSLVFDLADLPTVKPGIQPFLDAESRLDGVVLNAGVMMPPKGSVTKQGYELQLGTNNIGHHLVMRLLSDKLVATAKENPKEFTRIVWTSSSGHGSASPSSGVKWDKKTNEPTGIAGMSPGQLYGQSKAINIFQSYQWTKAHPDSNVLSLSVHPGFIDTELGRYSGKLGQKMFHWFAYPAKNGSYSELYALLYPKTKVFDVFGNGAIYVSPFGVVKKRLLRKDVAASAKGEIGENVWKYLDKETDQYV